MESGVSWQLLVSQPADNQILFGFSSIFFGSVKDVEDASHVEDAGFREAGLTRVGTHIAHKAQGLHRGFFGVCGSRGK
jgi:hypothetical protein